MQLFHPDSATLLANVQGELPDAERNALMSHLADCQSCRNAMQEVRSIASDATTAPMPRAGTALLDRIQASRAAGARFVLPSGDDEGITQREPIVSRRLIALAATLLLAALAALQSSRVDSKGTGTVTTASAATRDASGTFDIDEFTSAFSPWVSVAHAQFPDDNSSRPIDRGLLASDLTPARWSYVAYDVVGKKVGAPRFTRVVSLDRSTYRGRAVWQAVSTSTSARGYVIDTLLFDDIDLRPIVRTSFTGNQSGVTVRQYFDSPAGGEVLSVRTRVAAKTDVVQVDSSRVAVSTEGLVIIDPMQLQVLFRVKPLHAKWTATHGGWRYGQTATSIAKRTLRVQGSDVIRMPWGDIPVWHVSAGASGEQLFVSKQTGDIVRVVSGEYRTDTYRRIDLQVAP